MIDSVGYRSTALWYDISYSVSVLIRNLAISCQKDVDATRTVIQYLLPTRDFTIEWKSSHKSQSVKSSFYGRCSVSWVINSVNPQ